ncbi:MAG: late competence development ComFB family protein [Deferrisomatales bacterium]
MEYLSRGAVDYEVEGHSLGDVVNYHEVLVLEAMRRRYRSDPSLCRCETCLEDVFALALNALPARYIQATSVRAYREGPHCLSDDEVGARVAVALARVRARPRH